MRRGRGIIKTYATINIIVYYPKTEEGKKELSDKVADVHANTSFQIIKKLNCPLSQKLKLLDTTIAAYKNKADK